MTTILCVPSSYSNILRRAAIAALFILPDTVLAFVLLTLMFNADCFTPPLLDRFVAKGKAADLIECAQTNHRINHSSNRGCFTKKDGDEVVTKETHQTPVEAAYQE